METRRPHPWVFEFEVEEDADHCVMVVHLKVGERDLFGRGQSRRNPIDPQVPQIGEELAAARALQDLAQKLTHDAWATIEEYQITRETAD